MRSGLGPKLLFLVTEDWYFCSHRLPPARAARDAGFDVVVATRVGRHAAAITAEGFRLVPIGLRRSSRNPLREFWAIAELVRIYRRERPTVVHHVALKPTLYGSIAARLTRVPRIVNALAGLGFVFTSDVLLARLVRTAVVPAFRLLLNVKGGVVIVQNPEDQMHIAAGIVAPERLRLIRSSGVDLRRFRTSPERCGTPVVLLASRMLWAKGIGEFVEAAELLKAQGMSARFVLVGSSDTENPGAVPVKQLEVWRDSGVIEWWGERDDMPEVLAKASVVCLPSTYGEGVPKTLLEAAACGRAIVATDAPGCREIVKHEINGLLIPLRDPVRLATAVSRLLSDRALRLTMGKAGRALAEADFSEGVIAAQTLAVYQERS